MGIYKKYEWFDEENPSVAKTIFKGKIVNNTFLKLETLDIVLNEEHFDFDVVDPFNPASKVFHDIGTVVGHELGHALGLDHDLTNQNSVMFETLKFNLAKWFLSDQDKQAIQKLYDLETTENEVLGLSAEDQEDEQVVIGTFDLKTGGDCVHTIQAP